jgi:hypothetical protein
MQRLAFALTMNIWVLKQEMAYITLIQYCFSDLAFFLLVSPEAGHLYAYQAEMHARFVDCMY